MYPTPEPPATANLPSFSVDLLLVGIAYNEIIGSVTFLSDFYLVAACFED